MFGRKRQVAGRVAEREREEIGSEVTMRMWWRRKEEGKDRLDLRWRGWN